MQATWPPSPDRSPWVLAWLGGLVLIGLGTIGQRHTIAVFAVGVEVVFVLYLIRHLSFALSAARTVRHDAEREVLDPSWQPSVSVVVAVKNEIAVIEQLLGSLTALDYPSDRLQVLIVDDASTDGTTEYLARSGPTDFVMIHRQPGAGGGKSGALNEAIPHLTGEVVVVFDADHQPNPNVIRRHVRHYRNPSVGAVQGRCKIGNPLESAVASAVALEYEAGFLVNEFGRQSVFGLPAYGGANCSVRTTSLMDHGGWNPHSHTEDTDLTMRLVLAGEQVRYDVSAVDVEQAVTTLRQYWKQRYRWARGHQQVFRDYWQMALSSKGLGRMQRLETLGFLSIYHAPVLAFFATLLGISAALGMVELAAIPGSTILWPLLFLGPLAELGAAMLLAGVSRRRALGLLWFLPLYVLSMLIATTAWVDGVVGRRYSWVKTTRSTLMVAPR